MTARAAKKIISLVLPVYQEEAVIELFHKELTSVIAGIKGYDFELIYVNDGSTDRTADIIAGMVKKDASVRLLNLSRNFGHQNAITCGMDHADGAALICMDTDLQHPPSLIPSLIEKWEDGFDIVYTVRKTPEKISPFKHVTSWLFYNLINKLSNIDVPENAADFRLISRDVLDVFKKDLRERDKFIRGLVSWVGFKSAPIEYTVSERAAGESKYHIPRMVKFASSGLVSFSTIPLKLGIVFGAVFGFISIGFIGYALVAKFFTDTTVPGWTSMLAILSAFSAIQCFLIGLIGLYIGYIFDEVKKRPPYIISSRVEKSKRIERVPPKKPKTGAGA